MKVIVKKIRTKFFDEVLRGNKTFEEVGKMVGYSDYGIWMKVKKEVLKL